MRLRISPDEKIKEVLASVNKIKVDCKVEYSTVTTKIGVAEILVENSSDIDKLSHKDMNTLDRVQKYEKCVLIRNDNNYFIEFNRDKKILVVILAIILALGISTTVYAVGNYLSNKDKEAEENKSRFEAGEGEVGEGEVDRTSKAGETNGSELSFTVNTSPLIKYKTQEGNIIIENPEVNQYAMIAEIFLKDEEKTLVYTSPLIKPNKNIQKAKLTHKLEIGTYEAICFLNAVSNDEEQTFIGKVGVEITIVVQ